MGDILTGIILEHSGVENFKPNDVRSWRIPFIFLNILKKGLWQEVLSHGAT